MEVSRVQTWAAVILAQDLLGFVDAWNQQKSRDDGEPRVGMLHLA